MGQQSRPSRNKPLQPKSAYDRLNDVGKELEILATLSDARVHGVRKAIDLLKTFQTSSKRKTYKLFLHNVLASSSPEMVLLCAVALGQAKIVNMKNLRPHFSY